MVYTNSINPDGVYYNGICQRFSDVDFLDAARFLLFANHSDNAEAVFEMISKWEEENNIRMNYHNNGFDYIVADLGDSFVRWSMKNYGKTIDTWYHERMSKNTEMTWDEAVSVIHAFVTKSEERSEIYDGTLGWNVKLHTYGDLSLPTFDDDVICEIACSQAKDNFEHEINDIPEIQEDHKLTLIQEGRYGGHLVLFNGEQPVNIPEICYSLDNPATASYIIATRHMTHLDEIAPVLKRGNEALESLSVHYRVKKEYDMIMEDRMSLK